ncbi:MAG TPA: hypothetical protein VG889_20610 [Rhizomicrobium sp.]|nr:hypothetical protein [Rhizomicrobium sp.]
MTESKDFEKTYWYVPPRYLPALLAGTAPAPHAKPIVDQTVWRFQRCHGGYLTGMGATNIGNGWSYMMMIGSITPAGLVKISFSPLDTSSSGAITIGDGSFDGKVFVMQMTSGSASLSVTHWAHMAQLKPTMPEWHALPGYADTGVPDLTGLETPIV